MSTLNLYVASNPLNRAISLTDAHGHTIPPLSWVLSDVFPVIVTVLTGSNFISTVGTTASASVGLNNGGAPLTLDGLTIRDDTSYQGTIGLNTYELSSSLGGTARSKTFTFELQIISGSDIQTYQHDVNIRREIIANPLVHVSTITAIVSASYAKSASLAQTAKKIDIGDTTGFTGEYLLAEGQGTPTIVMGDGFNRQMEISPSSLYVYDNNLEGAESNIIKISIADSWISGSGNFGVGVSYPIGDNKLQVGGNIFCSGNITASTAVSASTYIFGSNTTGSTAPTTLQGYVSVIIGGVSRWLPYYSSP